ncbi:hypothetical protein SAMN04489844_1469 [Nocardioides exalbidus]|uniref:Uncharacterized protein n=1 Tax=Nocardioides exalbidus TaxID=402596 RepID=A0A1H4NWM4_9ACTN|nr:hypothetical protein SAMN04489844_1469 [Nocardioides exalbidus]
MPADSFDPDVKEAARARLRARAEETRRKASPELTARQVAGLLGCPVSRVIDWAGSEALYAFASEEGLRFPEWQFPDGQRVPYLDLVLPSFGAATRHPYTVEGFLADVPHEELDDLTAVQWLIRGGHPEPVVQLAMSVARGF